MVLNPAEPGGRRYDPLGQAEAKISELEQLLQKERDATEEQRRYHNKYRKRVRVLEHDLAELRKVLGDRASVVSSLSSRPSAHSNEVKVVEAYFERYEKADWVSIMMGVLARNKSIYGDDTQPFMIYDVADATAFEPVLKKILEMRDREIHDHIEREILTPERAELLRLLGQLSGNRMEWANSLYKFDHSALNILGQRFRYRQRLAPDSTFYFPELFPRVAMKAYETRVLALPANQNVQHADGKGAEAVNISEIFYEVYGAPFRDAHTGGWATAGTEADPHIFMLTGDGCGATADDSACGLRIFPGSVNKSNQSVHSIRNLAVWRGTNTEDYHTIMLRTASFRQYLCDLFVDGRLKRADGSFVVHPVTGGHVYAKLMLTGDKPFMCHILGRQNHNADTFSFQCTCRDSLNELYKLDFDKLTHYSPRFLRDPGRRVNFCSFLLLYARSCDLPDLDRSSFLW